MTPPIIFSVGFETLSLFDRDNTPVMNHSAKMQTATVQRIKTLCFGFIGILLFCFNSTRFFILLAVHCNHFSINALWKTEPTLLTVSLHTQDKQHSHGQQPPKFPNIYYPKHAEKRPSLHGGKTLLAPRSALFR